MSSCLSTAAPPSAADSLNSSWGRRDRRDGLLPYEILSAIFSYISHSHILHLRHLLFVCRSWSLVVLQEAELWSSIRIDYELHDYFHGWRSGAGFNTSQAENFNSLCISRSRLHPLSIILNFGSFALSSRTEDRCIRWNLVPLLATLIGPQGQHALRWHSLECYSLIYSSEIISILPPRLLQLKCLRLYLSAWDQGNASIFPRCPNLEVVELQDPLKYGRQLFGECESSNLKELLVESRCLEDLRYIASFRSVLRLTLSSSLKGADFEIKSPENIHLPQLKDLRLKGCVDPDLVGLLSAPSLNKVEFDHNESITSILCHLVSTNIETIAALIPPPVYVQFHVTIAAALIHLVTLLRGLRLLQVKRWIYDVMKASDCPLDPSGILGHDIHLTVED